MTDISNKLHIIPESKNNLENKIDDNKEFFQVLQNLPNNPEEIMKQAEDIQRQKAKETEEKKEK